MNVITDKNKINELLARGVEMIYPDRQSLEKVLLSGKRIKLYCGFDPSAPSLHIGNAILINKLAQFQELGHEVIFLIGDFTGMIGDPTDKTAARKKLTREEVLANAKNYKKQASAYLKFRGDNPAKVERNSKWLDKIFFKELIEISSNFTVQQMIQRDMFQERLRKREFKCNKCGSLFEDSGDVNGLIARGEVACPKCGAGADYIKQIKGTEPIYLHEFLYPVAQGYDSVALNVDLEIGGNDQMFNMMCGRDLMKAMAGKEKFVMTLKLLADEQGKKMGKSEGNVVFLDESPDNMYGKVMSWPDGVIPIGFELCTKIDLNSDDLKNLNILVASGSIKENNSYYQLLQKKLQVADVMNPRDLKMKLAFEITKLVHGARKAKAAQEHFIKTVQNKEIPDEIEEKKLACADWKLPDLLVETGLAASKGEARRLIEQGGVKIDNEVVKDINREITITAEGVLLQRGKRQFVKIKSY